MAIPLCVWVAPLHELYELLRGLPFLSQTALQASQIERLNSACKGIREVAAIFIFIKKFILRNVKQDEMDGYYDRISPVSTQRKHAKFHLELFCKTKRESEFYYETLQYKN
jgi:hypothetical protein